MAKPDFQGPDRGFVSKLERGKGKGIAPLPQQLAEDLLVNIESGLFPEGRLPSGEVIGAAYGVGEGTTTQALHRLIDTGVIKRRHPTHYEIIDRSAIEKSNLRQELTVYEKTPEEDKIDPREHGRLVQLIEENSSFSDWRIRTTVGLSRDKYKQLKDGHRKLPIKAVKKLVALVDTQPDNSTAVEEVTLQIQGKFPHTWIEEEGMGRKIIAIGADVGMTYNDLADCIGMSRNTIKAVQRGAVGLTVENIEKILREVEKRNTKKNKARDILKENQEPKEYAKEPEAVTVADALKGIRSNYEISQDTLGNTIPGGTPKRISRLESAKIHPTKKDIDEIVGAFQALGLPEDDALLLFLKERLSEDIITTDLREAVGYMPPGERLPTEVEFMVQYNCTRARIKKALGPLKDQGIIETRKGTYGGLFVPEQESGDKKDVTIADALKGIRSNYGISQATLGNTIPGGYQQRVSTFESAKIRPTKKNLAEIVTAFQELGVREDDSLVLFLKERLSEDIITTDLREAVGYMPPGERLPTEAEFMVQYNCTRARVKRALGPLKDQGIIETRKGRYGGLFVPEQQSGDKKRQKESTPAESGEIERRYLHPFLTREEENILIEHTRRESTITDLSRDDRLNELIHGSNAEKWDSMMRFARPQTVAEVIVGCNYSLIKKIAKKTEGKYMTRRSKIPYEELVDAGILGFAVAIKKFDPEHESRARLCKYAIPWIIESMQEAVAKELAIPLYRFGDINKLLHLIEGFQKTHNEDYPTEEQMTILLANITNLTPFRITRAVAFLQSDETSILNQPVTEGSDIEIIDMKPGEEYAPQITRSEFNELPLDAKVRLLYEQNLGRREIVEVTGASAFDVSESIAQLIQKGELLPRHQRNQEIIIRLHNEGLSNQEIAVAMGKTEHNIKAIKGRLYQKGRIRSHREAAAIAKLQKPPEYVVAVQEWLENNQPTLPFKRLFEYKS